MESSVSADVTEKEDVFVSDNNLPPQVGVEPSLPGAVVHEDLSTQTLPRPSGASRHTSEQRKSISTHDSRKKHSDKEGRRHSFQFGRKGSMQSLLERHASRTHGHTHPNQNHTIFATIANDEQFQNFTLLVICINALWIGVDTEWNHNNIQEERNETSPPLNPTAEVIENVFCFYFSIEVLIRFLAFQRKILFWKDAWFVFDSFLVLCMVVETWVIGIIKLATGTEGGPDFLSNFSALRLLRLLRLTRMMRLMRQVPELMVLVKGMISASQAVFFIMLFLVLVMYVFSIVFTGFIAAPENVLEEGYNAEYLFATMGDSMMTLFTNGVLGDNLADTVDALAVHSVPLMWLFFLFFFISSLTLLNMLIGVLCEVCAGQAKTEKEDMEESVLRFVIEDAFETMDINQDGKVSEVEWTKIKSKDEVKVAFIEYAGLDENCIDDDLDEMKVGLFGRTVCRKGLTLDELNERVIDIRPGKAGSLLALKLLERKQSLHTLQLEHEMESVEEKFEEVITRRNRVKPCLDGDDRLRPKRPGDASLANLPEPTSTHLHELPMRTLLQALKSRASGISPSTAAFIKEADQAWEERWSEDYAQYYYINRETGETTWQGPSNPEAWKEFWSEDYKHHYYVNGETGETRWHKPTNPEALRESGLADALSPASNLGERVQSADSECPTERLTNATIE